MFGQQLKFLRESKKLTQKDLAVALGVGASTVTKWERDERQPDFATLIQIADYFHVSTDRLLGRHTNSISELITEIFSLIVSLDKELKAIEILPEAITVYKDYKTQIDRLLLDLLSYRIAD